MKTPTAHIAVGKNRQKLYSDDTYYLNDGQEFEIELFNPTKKTVMAKIWLNGNLISLNGLVLYPGTRYFLDRFLDNPSKLKFSTYKVSGNNQEVAEAIEDNGGIRVEFYNEEDVQPNFLLNSNWNWNNTNVFGNSSGTTNVNYSDSNLGSPTMDSLSFGLTSDVVGSKFSADIEFSKSKPKGSDKFKRRSMKKKEIETGRVSEGSKSDQDFKEVNINFEATAEAIIQYKILPSSRKRVETADIRNYCTGCGARIKKQSWNNCPNCGAKL